MAWGGHVLLSGSSFTLGVIDAHVDCRLLFGVSLSLKLLSTSVDLIEVPGGITDILGISKD